MKIEIPSLNDCVAVAVIDPVRGWEWSTGSRPMRSASLIKLFIMVALFEAVRGGSIDLSIQVAFKESDRVGGAGTLQHLSAGTAFSALEMIDLMITESDNIATNLLIDVIGMDEVNVSAGRLGFADTHLRRKMMDFDAAARGFENLTSVVDAARLLSRLHRQECVGKEADETMCGILERQTDRCKIPLLLPSGTVCKNKTGELPGVENDAAIICSPVGAYIIAVMTDGLPNPEEARQTVATISLYLYDWFCNYYSDSKE